MINVVSSKPLFPLLVVKKKCNPAITFYVVVNDFNISGAFSSRSIEM